MGDSATTELTRSDPLIELAVPTMSDELRALDAALPPRDRAPTPEQIHQLRIVARRMRVALRIFAPCLPADSLTLAQDLKWLGGMLGEIRDLDVYAVILRGEAAVHADIAEAIHGLEAANDAARSQARANVTTALRSDRFGNFRARLADFVEQVRALHEERKHTRPSIHAAAGRGIRRSARRLRKAGRRIDTPSPPAELHRVRIRAKQLRYELDGFIDFYPKLKKLARAARRLQDTLGAYHDACIAAERLRGRALRRPEAAGGCVEEQALLRLIWSQEERASGLRDEFALEWQRFERVLDQSKLPD
jgi:CHAD domain-containing protein